MAIEGAELVDVIVPDQPSAIVDVINPSAEVVVSSLSPEIIVSTPAVTVVVPDYSFVIYGDFIVTP